MSNDPFAEVLACHTALSGGSFPTTPSIGALVPVADVASNSDQDKPTHHSQGLFLAEFGADDWMPTNKSVRTQGIPSTRIASAQADTINLEEDPWDTMDMVGEMLKKGGVLLLWSAAELDLFMKKKNSVPAGQLVMLFHLMLRILDKLEGMANHAEAGWEPSEDLKRTSTIVIKSILLLYCLTSYDSHSVAILALSALQRLQVAGMPPETDFLNLHKLIQILSWQASRTKSDMKHKIILSVQTNKSGNHASTQNIAHLLKSLLPGSKVCLIATLYMCIAFLCWHYLKYKALTDKDAEKWWAKVTASVNSATALGPIGAHDLFASIYKEDVAQFGDPMVTSIQITSTTDLGTWNNIINEQALKPVDSMQLANTHTQKYCCNKL